jgi:ACT domain-containing protein
VICAHGELTPKYKYITDLRHLREKAKQHQEEYMQHVKELERKTSSLKRGMRFATVVFSGHLFDTKFFNSAIDILESLHIDFRVVDWQVGCKVQNSSQVTMQLFAKDAECLDQAKEKIEKEAALKKIEINEGSGPAFDANILEEGV